MTGRLAARAAVPSWLPEVALAVAVVIAVARLFGIDPLAAAVDPVLPLDPGMIDSLDAATAILLLGALAVGVRRRKRLVWPLAVATFAGAAVGQVVVLRHPLGAGLAVACLGVLLLEGPHYRVRTDVRLRHLVVLAAIVGCAVLIVGAVASAEWTSLGMLLDVLFRRAAEAIAFVDPTGLAAGTRGENLFEAVEFAVRTAVLVAALVLLVADPDRPAAAELDASREVVRRHATGGLAPFQAGPDALLFAHVSGGVIAYGRAGRTAVILGDPIGPRPAAQAALRAFLARCARGDVGVAVYQAGRRWLDDLRGAGFRVFRVGEEAVVPLEDFDLNGKRRANLRHTVTRAARGGAVVSWHPDGLAPDEIDGLRGQLLGLDREWQRTHGRRMRFTISRFELDDLRSVGVATAIVGGQVDAFATFRRTGDRAWVLDVMRRREGGVPGALESCIAVAAEGMRAAGGRELSLGLVALAGLERPACAEERILAVARRLVRPLYDVDGLSFFKRKFDPAWEPRYGAVRGRLGFVGFATTLLRLHLAIGAAAPPHDEGAGPPRHDDALPDARRPAA